jgi:threonine/homoserine/homoserine lactone efflux protein
LGWFRAFFRELLSMPLRHMIVFLVSTVLLILLEVELTEGWHLIHIIQILGGMVFVYLLWAAWKSKN